MLLKPIGGSGQALTVEEIDGAPSVASVIKIKAPNGTITDNGGGIITLDYIRSSLTANLDFATFKAVAMACDNGAILPAAPVVGQWFLHTPTGRKILMQYDGANWLPIMSMGAMTVYVDGTSGTDDPSKGTGTGVNAFNTIQYAVNSIPGLVGGNVAINVAAGIYREDIDIWGKNFTGTYAITIEGTRSTISGASGTASSGANPTGNGSAGYGTLTDSTKAWTANAYQNKFLEITVGTGAGQIRAIHSNTATQITITGRWDTVPDVTSQYRAFQLDTRITGADAGAETTIVRGYVFKIDNGQGNINLQRLKIDYASNNIQPYGGCTWALAECHIEGGKWGINTSESSSGSVLTCVFRIQQLGDIIMDRGSSIKWVKRCRLTGSNTRSLYVGSSAVMYDLMETYIGQVVGAGVGVYIFMNGVLLTDAYLEIDGCASHGINLFASGVVFVNGNYGAPATQVIKNNGGWGLLSESGGFGSGASAITYSGNTSGAYSPTTSIAGGNT